MDAGYVIYDGTPRACGNCDAGREFEQAGGRRLNRVPRAELNPRILPPGGDVLITEMKRRDAGLPVGVIGSDVLIRAQVEAQPLVHDLVRLVDDFTRDTPGVDERAIELLGGLPEWAIPDDVTNRDSALQTEPPPAEPLASPDPRRGDKRRGGSSKPPVNPAAPLEPPPA
jgi:hypothetical protein